ncbi:hypothetical protein RDABS01_038603 [Bienertia sinuspersici]
MATSVKGGANGGKEKRGTSPSNSILKKSSKPSSSSSSLNDENNSSSPTESSKPVPNYLKPTMSSSLDFSRLPKKSGSETSAQKPTHNRRRSFDRPPPSSQVQRTFRGPPGGPRDIKPQRSASFSNKSNSSSVRPASEKLFARTSSLKDKKVDEHKLSRPKTMKKSTLSSTSTKKEPTSSSTSSTKKAPKSVTSESSVDYDHHPSVDHVAIEEDDLVNLDDHEVQSLPEMSEMPDVNQELADPTHFSEVDELKQFEEDTKGSTLKEDHHLVEDKSMVADDKLPLQDSAEYQEIEDTDNHQTVVQEPGDDQQKVDASGDQQILLEGAEDQQDDSQKTVSEMGPTEPIAEEKMEDEDEEKEGTKVTEVEKDDQQETERKDEEQTVSSPSAEAAAPAAKTQSSTEKKDKQAYNDVIEETATKLMGGRKNKVLALAGAFETVISLQDTNKS